MVHFIWTIHHHYMAFLFIWKLIHIKKGHIIMILIIIIMWLFLYGSILIIIWLLFLYWLSSLSVLWPSVVVGVLCSWTTHQFPPNIWKKARLASRPDKTDPTPNKTTTDVLQLEISLWSPTRGRWFNRGGWGGGNLIGCWLQSSKSLRPAIAMRSTLPDCARYMLTLQEGSFAPFTGLLFNPNQKKAWLGNWFKQRWHDHVTVCTELHSTCST